MRARSRHHSRLQRNFSVDIAKTDEQKANNKKKEIGLHFMVCRYVCGVVYVARPVSQSAKQKNVAPLRRNLCH